MATKKKGRPASKVKADGPKRSREQIREARLKLGEKIAGMREDKKMQWADICEKLGIDQPSALTLYLHATVKPKDKIKYADDDDLAKQVVTLRDSEGTAWHVLGARSGTNTAKVKRLYNEAKGGKVSGRAKPKPAAKKAASEPTEAKVAPRRRKRSRKVANPT
jgi:hypothetical protein